MQTPTTFVRRLYAVPLIEGSLVGISVIGFIGGVLYWYGPQLAVTPPYLWLWLIDSPLAVLGYAVALPLVWRGYTQIRWVATWSVFGNIKYGLWTMVFWSLWWQVGHPFTLESIAMTLTHGAMVAMGLSLLLYYRPQWQDVVGSTVWFAFNDYLDYWQGLAPTVPAGVPLDVLQVEQLIVTAGLSSILLMLSRALSPVHE